MVLAGHLGMTLGELGERMSAQEFELWWARHQRVPIGEIRADLHTGIVASTVANMAGKVLKGQNMPPADFMPKYEKPEEPDPMQFFGAM